MNLSIAQRAFLFGGLFEYASLLKLVLIPPKEGRELYRSCCLLCFNYLEMLTPHIKQLYLKIKSRVHLTGDYFSSLFI